MSKEIKTNAMRMLDKAKLPYEVHHYDVTDENYDGVHAAQMLGLDPAMIYKTLLLHGEKTGYLVCVIPVAESLDLKQVARIANDKKVEMAPVKDLLAITGYVRGGCSPVGMKKKFPTFFDETFLSHEQAGISGGQRGCQMLVSPKALVDYLGGRCAKLTV